MSYLYLNRQGQLTLAQTSQPQFTGVSYQTSAQAIPIPIFWGQRRISPNVIWWSPPLSTAPTNGHNSFSTPDSGGGLVGIGSIVGGLPLYGQVVVTHSGGTSTYYDNGNDVTNSAARWWIPMIFALCEGPLDATNTITRLWNGGGSAAINWVDISGGGGDISTAFQPASLFYTIFLGAPGQTPWAFWTEPFISYPDQDLSYPNTAYIAAPLVDAGHNFSLPQQSFECQRHYPDATAAIGTDYGMWAIIPDLLTHPIFGCGLSAGDVS